MGRRTKGGDGDGDGSDSRRKKKGMNMKTVLGWQVPSVTFCFFFLFFFTSGFPSCIHIVLQRHCLPADGYMMHGSNERLDDVWLADWPDGVKRRKWASENDATVNSCFLLR